MEAKREADIDDKDRELGVEFGVGGVAGSKSWSERDVGIGPYAGDQTLEMHCDHQTRTLRETQGALCGFEFVEQSGLPASPTERAVSDAREREVESDPAGCKALAKEGERCLSHCATHVMGRDPLPYEAEKYGDCFTCRMTIAAPHHTDDRTSHVFGESLKCPAKHTERRRMERAMAGEGDIWPAAGYEEVDDGGLGECRAEESYEQLPDIAGLTISSTTASTQEYPEDSSTREYVTMCDYQAADETQLSLFWGDRVVLLSSVTEDWWWVEHNGNQGYVPASYLHRIDDEDDVEDDDPWQDEEYYGSYKTLRLHLEMLSDCPRTQAYKDVILHNTSALKGKRILDLGCGTGIISFFCAQLAQPEVVYAVEASDIAEQTSQLAEANGLSAKVKVIRQRAEELELPSKVDVLVSEWMGTCLVFEFMLESVLLVRDLWLEEGGVMWPSTASIHMVPCSAEKEYASKVLFWDSAYGLDFSILKPMAVQEFLPKPDYVLNPEDCLSAPCLLLDVDMKTLKIEELERMSSSFTFHVERDGIFHGFTVWFSVHFQNLEDPGSIELNTGPFSPLTHWKHTLFMLDEPVQVNRGDKIQGTIVFHRNPFWKRHLSVRLGWTVTKESGTAAHSVGCKIFPVWR